VKAAAKVCEAIAGEIIGTAAVCVIPAGVGIVEAAAKVCVATAVGVPPELAAEICVPAAGEIAEAAVEEPDAAGPLDNDCGALDEAIAS
jgi:hypothetical protein